MATQEKKTNTQAEAKGQALGTCIAVVRIRGKATTPRRTEDAMLFMNLTRVHHCTLLPYGPEVAGTIERAKDFITWGTPSEKTIEELFAKAGRTMPGNKPLTDGYVKEKTGFASVKELADKVYAGQAKLSSFRAVKPIFRLSPARGGFGSIKKIYPKGALGRRDTPGIDKLIAKML